MSDPKKPSAALTIGCELRFRPRGDGILLLHVEAMRAARQTVAEERLRILAGNAGPEVPFERHVTAAGNRLVRIVLSPRGPTEIAVIYNARAVAAPLRHDPATVAEIPLRDLPFECLPYLLPSRYCQSDKLGRFAAQRFGALAPGHARVTAICNWLYDHIDYVKGSSDTHTTVHDTLVSRAGVCRDFAHLGIALCRALGIPARFVSAYAADLQPPDFHAVFEAYLAGRWYLFDPTRQASLDRIARIGVGRDAADVSFSTIYGDVEPDKPVVSATFDGHPAPPTLKAVSLTDG